MSAGKVDVLAVMDERIRTFEHRSAQDHHDSADYASFAVQFKQWKKARAAVAELIANDRRYRYLRDPNNAIVYAKHPEAWGYQGSPSGYVKWERPELLDAALDAALARIGGAP